MIKKLKNIIHSLLMGKLYDSLKKSEIKLELQYAKSMIKSQIPLNMLVSKCEKRNAADFIYSDMHKSGGYLENNWGYNLLNYQIIDKYNTVFEIGAGNGKFLDYLRVEKDLNTLGIDLINPSGNIYIKKKSIFDITVEDLGKAELIYSSDFLEHLNLVNLCELFDRNYIKKLDQLHTIALYDDGISHETILQPSEWYLFFSKFFNTVEIIDINYRRSNFSKKALTIFASNKS